MSEYDYSEYAEAPANDAFAELAGLVSDLSVAELRVAELEKDLKAAKKAVVDVEEGSLPEKMVELGLKEVTLRNGLTIKINQKLYVSLPKKDPDRYERGILWFANHGYEKIVKNKLVAEFGKGRAEEAEKVAEELREKNFSVANVQEIHPSTLKAFFKRWLEDGNEDPEVDEIFAIHQVDVAKVR
jgi:hypothetical protein